MLLGATSKRTRSVLSLLRPLAVLLLLLIVLALAPAASFLRLSTTGTASGKPTLLRHYSRTTAVAETPSIPNMRPAKTLFRRLSSRCAPVVCGAPPLSSGSSSSLHAHASRNLVTTTAASPPIASHGEPIYCRTFPCKLQRMGARAFSVSAADSAGGAPAPSGGPAAAAGAGKNKNKKAASTKAVKPKESSSSSGAAGAPTELVPLPSNEESEHLVRVRHSAAHVLAMAVQRLRPEARVAAGPWTEHGFFYDFYFPDGSTLSEEDLGRVRAEMADIVARNLPFRREEVSLEEARRRIEGAQEPFKLELLERIAARGEAVSLYHVGEEWWDLCAGPHLERTGQLSMDALQLDRASGAYWMGDETKPMLQRVHGTAWETPAQLATHRVIQAEAARRDHRTIGKTLDLFSIQQASAGGGLVFWHPRGARVRRAIEDFWKAEHVASGYELLYTPHMANVGLWNTSGHTEFYRDSMFRAIEVEEEHYMVKPMNCPFHCLVYKNSLKSYRQLPLRWAELGTVYRYERSGTMHGLMRVRGFTQDDAHIFCLPSQLQGEIGGVLDLVHRVLQRFGFTDFDVMLSTRPKESVGDDAIWEASTAALRGALAAKGWNYGVDEGGGAFYGPKIDIKIKDAIGRKWQCSTIQCDFNLPERFELEYASADGSKQRPVMVHRAIFGSLERFFGVLLEHTMGDLPLWLAPEQLRLLPVTDEAHQYCYELKRQAEAKWPGLRVSVDESGERLGKQIRNAEQQKVPLMAVVGKRELESKGGERRIPVRSHRLGDLGEAPADQVFALIQAAAGAYAEVTSLQQQQ